MSWRLSKESVSWAAGVGEHGAAFRPPGDLDPKLPPYITRLPSHTMYSAKAASAPMPYSISQVSKGNGFHHDGWVAQYANSCMRLSALCA